MPRIALLLLLLFSFLPQLHAGQDPNWTAPQTPFRILGNLYYVGSRDLAVYLLVTPQGNILINSNLESSPPQIRASVEALGFRWADTRILLNSQAHFDHAAGTAAIVTQTHARLMVMDGDAPVMESGDRHGWDHLPPFPPAHVDRVLHDGETVTLGGTTLTAHKTPGHTAGCTTWTLDLPQDLPDGHATRHVVILGGLMVLDEYRLIATPGHPASYPGIEQDFRHTFALLRTMPCDIFLGAHGSYFNMQAKLARLPREGAQVWIDPQGLLQAVQDAEQHLDAHLAAERAGTLPSNP